MWLICSRTNLNFWHPRCFLSRRSQACYPLILLLILFVLNLTHPGLIQCPPVTVAGEDSNSQSPSILCMLLTILQTACLWSQTAQPLHSDTKAKHLNIGTLIIPCPTSLCVWQFEKKNKKSLSHNQYLPLIKIPKFLISEKSQKKQRKRKIFIMHRGCEQSSATLLS